MTPGARQKLSLCRYVLLDFDGPVCNAFAGYPAHEVADALRRNAVQAGVRLPDSLRGETDPMKVLLGLWRCAPWHHPAAEALQTSAEVSSVASASLTPGALPFIRACSATHRPVAIVSNNAPEAIVSFLEKHDLTPLVEAVIGRDKATPELMKPNPHLPQLALRALGTEPAGTCLVGDSTTDIEVAQEVGVMAVGYANRPGKRVRFEELGADIVTEHMQDLADVLTD